MLGNPQRSARRAAHPPLTAEDFAMWQALIEQEIGVVISAQSQGFLQLALEERMRVLNLSDPAHYYQRLIDGSNRAFEWSQLLANLTVQETAFFRHRPSFEAVRNYLKQRLPTQGERPLMLWSVGCSSGEETYSLAITAFEALRGSQTPFGVLGSDISEAALAKARAGRYSAKRLSGVSNELKQRYFVFNPAQEQFRVSSELAAKVCFTRLNVLALAQEPFFNLDVIFCHNLLIYFRHPRRLEILNQLASRLTAGGLLLIGSGEAPLWQHPELTAVAGGVVQGFIRKQQRGAE